MRPDQIAVQLFSVRQLMATDLAAALRAVADAGYGAVELAGLPDVEPDALARLVSEAQLRVVASHETIATLRQDPRAVASRLVAVGCPRAVVTLLPEEDRRTAGDVRRFATELGDIGRSLAGHGVRLGHHNRGGDFAPLDGTTAWDILREELPPDIELELDVYWAAVAGRDAVTEIRSAADRLRLLHVKDVAAGPEASEAPAGEGILDIPAIVAAGRAVGVEWYITEQVVSDDPLRDIRTSARYLASLAG